MSRTSHNHRNTIWGRPLACGGLSGRPARHYSSKRKRGGALLAVLWLSAALTAIAFAVATTVRGEAERASTLTDGLRCYYLARGGIDRGIMHALHGRPSPPGAQIPGTPPGSPPAYNLQTPLMRFEFPTGVALVELIPETARLNLNTADPLDLIRLLTALGADSDQARQITAGLVALRRGLPIPGVTDLSFAPSFPGRPASLEEVEEALLVPGMTPDIFYGNYARDPQGRLVRLGGFRDCVSIFGSQRTFDVNGAEPALLMALGMSAEGAQQVVRRRRIAPIRNLTELTEMAPLLGPAVRRLHVGGNTIYTFRSTARLRLPNGSFSDVRRTVAAQVKFLKPEDIPRYHVIRWYDNVTSEVAQWQ